MQVLKKGGFFMKSQKKFFTKAIKAMAEKSLKSDANSTTCMAVYQPKAPATLKKFSKIDNAK